MAKQQQHRGDESKAASANPRLLFTRRTPKGDGRKHSVKATHKELAKKEILVLVDFRPRLRPRSSQGIEKGAERSKQAARLRAKIRGGSFLLSSNPAGL